VIWVFTATIIKSADLQKSHLRLDKETDIVVSPIIDCSHSGSYFFGLLMLNEIHLDYSADDWFQKANTI
jgi:hypothetical protein